MLPTTDAEGSIWTISSCPGSTAVEKRQITPSTFAPLFTTIDLDESGPRDLARETTHEG